MRLVSHRAIAAGLVGAAAVSVAAFAQQPQQLMTPAEGFNRNAKPTDSCSRLAGLSGPTAVAFARIPNAPVTIKSAQVVPAGGDGSIAQQDHPESCRIEGQIPPNIGFLLRMPTKTWNGKMMMGGCGGPCGNYLEDRIDPAFVRNYATVTTDMGHKGVGWGFGYNNPMGMIDFGYRATHVSAVAAKEVIKAFYGEEAKYNYFFGCSTGGRQGMVSAQRFPWDFDGIVAGALPWTQTGYQSVNSDWPARINTRADGSLILGKDLLPIINAAVLKSCDARDGLRDGVLQDPLGCAFQPVELLCKGAATQGCLTSEQVGVLERIYSGPFKGRDGGPRYFVGQGGLAKGGELKWRDLGPWRGDANTMSKYFNIFDPRGPQFDDRTIDMEAELGDLALTEWIFSPMNPDLRNFKAAGGKLILFHGWDDGVPAEPTIEYYEAATRLLGGEAATKDFFRLFMLGGMDHCRGGEGGGEADWITHIENWVEKGQAPDEITAYHYTNYPTVPRQVSDYGAPYLRTARHPLKPGEYDRAHPVYPYPDTPIYSGKGDPADPQNWRKAAKPTRLTSQK